MVQNLDGSGLNREVRKKRRAWFVCALQAGVIQCSRVVLLGKSCFLASALYILVAHFKHGQLTSLSLSLLILGKPVYFCLRGV